ncbi:unnamed protein product [Lampetra fluviatilis]
MKLVLVLVALMPVNKSIPDGKVPNNRAFAVFAMQSSTVGPDHNASKAIDGTNGTNFCSGMCSATSYEWEPWFCIALDDVYTVDAVSITNRNDAEGIRLFGAHIKVGESSNHNDNALCADDIFVTPGQSARFTCPSQQGRYVFIVIPGRMDSLSLYSEVSLRIFATVLLSENYRRHSISYWSIPVDPPARRGQA